ncbi:MAG: cation-translocating P-type ATPase, partial [Ruminococcaceae bacterium]|nr:cation-translocating P-type ATPase [Oscillospiraceae bacterium]
SDKTGTLTQNRMTLVRAVTDSGADEKIGFANGDEIKKLLLFGSLCCDGSVAVDEKGVEHPVGDPTETSIISAAMKNGMTKEALNQTYPRVAEIPFDSDRKLMTTVNVMDGKNVVIVKGAFDVMAKRCTAGNIDAAAKLCDSMSSEALRVLAVGYKYIDTVPAEPTSEELECGLTFMGLVGMIDPPRPEAAEAVKLCRRAGIKPVMITGDHVVTASAIARDIGILEDGDKAITGAELDAMSEEELDSTIEDISVYARVSPENKIRIVKAWQKKDHVVSMTGDGVNDAPALKAADIGCAMGITGTDVAKGAADMTLTDDNFATIVDAVREGRGIFANIKKVVGFLLGTNIGEVLLVFFAMILWHKTPLLSMHLLWINLVTDSMPAIALGMEPVEEGVMDVPPKPKNEGIFAGGLGIKVVLQGCLFALLSLAAFAIGVAFENDITGGIFSALKAPDTKIAFGQTMAFMVLSLSQVVQAFNMRSNRSLFKTGFFTNKKLNGAVMISLALVALVLFTPLNTIFQLSFLPAKLYLIGLGLSLVPLVVMEVAKAVERIFKK